MTQMRNKKSTLMAPLSDARQGSMCRQAEALFALIPHVSLPIAEPVIQNLNQPRGRFRDGRARDQHRGHARPFSASKSFGGITPLAVTLSRPGKARMEPR
jgi:hypothetical protein